jgi:N-glycosidase YbiA
MSNKKVIDSFTLGAGYAFLSNFHPSTIVLDGKPYKTVEHAYQAHKTLDEGSRELIRNSPDPAQAKKLGRGVTVRPDWDAVKVDLMREFIRKKFESPFLAHMLLETGDSDLVYGNTWNDKFWGVCRGVGQNWLGKILMEVRSELSRIDD